MRNPPGDRVTESIPVPARIWTGAAGTCHCQLTITATEPGEDLVELAVIGPVIEPDDSIGVLLGLTQIDELITDLMRRRALLATGRAGSERSDR